MSLDPPKSDAELLALALRQGAKVDAPLSPDQLRRRQVGKLVDCQPSDEPPSRPRRLYVRGEVTLGELHFTLRAGQMIEADGIILGAARSKKNHKQNYGNQSEGYKHWQRGIVRCLVGRPQLADQKYNLNAQFYVDSKGVPADLAGLIQGFIDALEDAGMVSDDHLFGGFDGSRKHDDQTDRPRVEFAITPL